MQSRESEVEEQTGDVAPRGVIRVLGSPAYENRRQNPYNALLSTALTELGVEVEEYSLRRLLFGRASILHLHWKPTGRIRGRNKVRVAMRAAGLLILLWIARLRGVRVIWTAHNLESHDSIAHPRLERYYWRILPRFLDAVISLSPSAVPLLQERYRGLREVPMFVVPHGNYRDVYPRKTRAAARAHLGIAADARVFAFVGQVRPYKNVIALLHAFREIRDPNAMLLIGGTVKLGKERAEFEALVASDKRVRAFPRFVPDDELQFFFGAADLVVLPFASILNSGSAILALSFDRPVLVPAAGSLADLAQQIGSDWVITYTGQIRSDVMEDAMEMARSRAGERAPTDCLDWNHIAAQTLDVYLEVLA